MKYLVGYYQYREMAHPKIACEREINLDCLPCTMIHPILTIEANNKPEAIIKYKARC